MSTKLTNRQVLDGDGEERTKESGEDAQLMRDVASSGIVLLKNEGSILPLSAAKLKKVAIVGGNAKALVLSGGGSASLKPSYFISPYDGIVKALGPNVEVTYTEGARGESQFVPKLETNELSRNYLPATVTLPSLDYEIVTEKGEKGWIGSFYNTDSSLAAVGDVVETKLIDETSCFISTSYPKNITERWMLKLNGKLKPRSTDQKFEFGLTVAGRAKVCPSFCPP